MISADVFLLSSVSSTYLMLICGLGIVLSLMMSLLDARVVCKDGKVIPGLRYHFEEPSFKTIYEAARRAKTVSMVIYTDFITKFGKGDIFAVNFRPTATRASINRNSYE